MRDVDVLVKEHVKIIDNIKGEKHGARLLEQKRHSPRM
jgi:hypothetical protein